MQHDMRRYPAALDRRGGRSGHPQGCARGAFIQAVDSSPPLSDLERALLHYASESGETTTTLDQDMLESSPGRNVVQTTLRGLVARGLMTTNRGLYLGGDQAYEDDWWDVTPAGRAAIGVPPRPPGRWMNPSSGPFRVSPLIAPWCAWRFRHCKRPLPDWYLRLTGRPHIRAHTGASRADGESDSPTGLTGRLWSSGGPHPGSRVRLAGTITVLDASSGAHVASQTVDEHEPFSLTLAPGTYTVAATSPQIQSGQSPCAPETVTVASRQRVSIDLVFHIR